MTTTGTDPEVMDVEAEIAVIEVDPEELEWKSLKGGTYQAVILDVGAPKPTRYDPEQQEVPWKFRLEGNDDSQVNGHVLVYGTNVSKGRGDQFNEFCRTIGCEYVDDQGRRRIRLDRAQVKGLRVLIEVTERPGKNRNKQKVIYNDVARIVSVLEG